MYLSFNKYNFFNTDSAVQLLNEKSPKQIKNAFQNISLGENVNYIEKRLNDYKLAFREELKRCEKQIIEYENSTNLEKNIIEKIVSNENNLKNLFSQFIEEVNNISWKGELPISPEDSYLKFEKDCNMAKICLDYILRNVNWRQNLTLGSLKMELNRLKTIKGQIDFIDLDIENSLNELNELYKSLDKNVKKVTIEEKISKLEDIVSEKYHMRSIFVKSYSKELDKKEEVSINSEQDTFEILIQNKIEIINSSLGMLEKVLEIIPLLDEDSIREKRFKIELINDFFEKLRAEKNKVYNIDIVEQSYKTKIKENEYKIKETRKEKEIILKGYSAIDTILDNQSIDNYLRNFILENKKEISKVFNAIHSPREFEDVDFTNDSIILKRIEPSEEVDLTKISTGQRSALALSIFLTLNRKVQNGPPYLIFDDPFSYIDDLNTLAFLDYLREVVVNTKRQIFFATANENLAFLISQKFNFLGDSEFKMYELTR